MSKSTQPTKKQWYQQWHWESKWRQGRASSGLLQALIVFLVVTKQAGKFDAWLGRWK